MQAQWGIGCISFNGNKVVTCGGGGAILTQKKLAEKARYLVSQAKDDSIKFIHNDIGYNYKITNYMLLLDYLKSKN